MANWYVNSAAAGTNAGTSWVNACTTIATVLGKAVAAGDSFFIANTHNESTAGSLTWTWPGTAALPNYIYSTDTTNTPPTAADILAGAKATGTGTTVLAWKGYTYCYGLTLNIGTGATNPQFLAQNGVSVFDTCAINTVSTNAATAIVIGGPNSLSANVGSSTFLNTTISFASTGQLIQVVQANFTWKNTAGAITGSTFPTALFQNCLGSVILDGVDLSALGSGKTILGSGNTVVNVQIINGKLGASVVIASTPTTPNIMADLVISDSAATGYRQERYRYQGTLTTSTTVYNNATDGVTPISWAVTSTANANRQSPFECFQIAQWAAAGTYAATLVQITSATAALTNADVWVEAEYLGNASFPIASIASSGPATQLTTGSSLAAGSWAVGGLGHNYQLALPSFATALAGYVRFTVKVAKASLTVNIDPDVAVA